MYLMHANIYTHVYDLPLQSYAHVCSIASHILNKDSDLYLLLSFNCTSTRTRNAAHSRDSSAGQVVTLYQSRSSFGQRIV